MAEIDFSAGYRDATKGSTLKALQARRAQMQTQIEEAMKPEPIASMWQGAAHVGGVIGSSIREARVANQEASGRERFAKLLAGGLTPDEIGEAMNLDPEITMKYQQHEWDSAAKRDEETNLRARELMKKGWDVDAAAERARVEMEAKKADYAHQDTTASTLAEAQEKAAVADDARAATAAADDDARAATAAVADDTRGAAEKRLEEKAAIEKAKEDQRIKEAAIGTETEARKAEWLKLNPEGDINSPEAQSYILRDAAEPTGGFGGPQGIKAVQEFRQQGNLVTSSLNDVNEAKSLVMSGNVMTGDAAKWVVDQASKFGESGIDAIIQYADQAAQIPGLGDLKGLTREKINATKRIYAITDSIANIRMSQTLKGANTDKEMARFESIFSDPGSTPEMRMQALGSLEQAFKAEHETVNSSLIASGQQGLDPYEYKPVANPLQPGSTEAPGNTEEPKVGDIFSAPGQPDLEYKGNGQYGPVGAR